MLNDDEVVYEDNSILIKKICLWENCRIVEDDETIISPKYTSIHYSVRDRFFIVKVSGKENYIYEVNVGLITLNDDTILPIEFKSVSIENNLIIARNDIGTTLYKIIRKGQLLNENFIWKC